MTDNNVHFSDGEGYERVMGRWSRLVGDIFLDWLAAPQALRWLDVGCGNGAFTESIAARCAPADVHGIDPSEAQIAYARARESATRIEYHVGEAQALPFDDASFDVAAMALVISFLAAPVIAVEEMIRVVRPGGMVANYMWDIPAGGVPLSPLRNGFRALDLPMPPAPPGAEVSRLEKMQALWEDVNLQEVEARRINIEIVFADFDDFWQSNTRLGSPLSDAIRALPQEDLTRLHDWLRDSLAPEPSSQLRYGAIASAVKGVVPG